MTPDVEYDGAAICLTCSKSFSSKDLQEVMDWGMYHECEDDDE